MTNWEKMLCARTRYGSFVGQGRVDEDAYYAFYDDSGPAVLGLCAAAVKATIRILRPRASGAPRIVGNRTEPS